MVKDLVNNPSRLFWVLHLGGWLAWALFAKYAYTVITLDEVPPRYFAYAMVISAIGMLLTLVLRYLFKALWGRSLWLQGAGLLIGTVAAGYAWMQARSYLYMTFIETREDVSAWMDKMGDAAEIYAKVSYMSTFTVAWFVILAWSALYFGIKYYRVFQEVQRSALKSAAMAHEAQLKMLRYQLNPHFLFNTLNAISTLILEQATADANRMVTRLSSFLRHSLDNDPMQKISLEQEISALKLYLDIDRPGPVTAADIQENAAVEIVNPDLVLCHLNEGAHLRAEILEGRPEALRRDLAEKAVASWEDRLERDRWPEYYEGEHDPQPALRARLNQSWSIGAYLYAKAGLEDQRHIDLCCWPNLSADSRQGESAPDGTGV